MTQLETLIQTLCPNGVKFVKLGEVAEVGTGRSNGNEAIETGEYPFFVRSKDVKRLDKFEFDEEAIIIGGGGKKPLWRQITADILGITLVRKKYNDSSFGSAMLAGVVSGFWKDAKEAVNLCNEAESVTKPNLENTAVYKEIFKKYKAVHDALAPIYHGEY